MPISKSISKNHNGTIFHKKHTMENINQAFRNLVNGDTGTVYNGTPGTCHTVRTKVWEEFRKTYPTSVTVSIEGAEIELAAHHSKSGLSTFYRAALTIEQYRQITGSKFGLSTSKTPSLAICAGIVEVRGGGRYIKKIKNDEVTIVN